MDTNNTNDFYEGEAIRIRGKEYIVPGLSLGQIERYADKIESISAGSGKLSKEMVEAVIEITHAAISRNYPEIKPEDIKDMLDMRNMKTVLEAVMGASGLIKGAAGGNGAKGAALKRS